MVEWIARSKVNDFSEIRVARSVDSPYVEKYSSSPSGVPHLKEGIFFLGCPAWISKRNRRQNHCDSRPAIEIIKDFITRVLQRNGLPAGAKWFGSLRHPT